MNPTQVAVLPDGKPIIGTISGDKILGTEQTFRIQSEAETIPLILVSRTLIIGEYDDDMAVDISAGAERAGYQVCAVNASAEGLLTIGLGGDASLELQPSTSQLLSWTGSEWQADFSLTTGGSDNEEKFLRWGENGPEWYSATPIGPSDADDLPDGSTKGITLLTEKAAAADIVASTGNDTQAKLLSLLGNPSRSQTTDDGLFAMYSFDRLEAGNTSVRDDFGTTALPLTGTPSPVTGVAGNGMECQCTSKFGELAAVPDCLAGTGDWAISFWHDFGDANLSSDVGLFGGAYVTGNYYSKGITLARKGSNATLYAQVSSADSRATVTKASYTPSAGFSHYVWMRSGTTLSLYINGTLINTATVAADFSIAWGTMKPRIGSSRFSTASIVNIADNGTQAIDEVRIYSRALTTQEIFALYHMKTVSLDPATILALLGGDVVQASSGRRFKMCAGVIRATGDGSTWEFISDSTHAPVGFDATTPIEVSGSGIRVNYADLAATKVVSFIAVPDETFTALGYQFGATVATGYAIITCGCSPQVIQGTAVYTDSAWVVASSETQGSLALDSYTDGVLKLTHTSTSGRGAQVSSFGGGGLPSVKTINDAYIEVEFRDYAGTLITSPSEGLGCTVLRTYPVYQRTMGTLNVTGANVWLFGIFEVA